MSEFERLTEKSWRNLDPWETCGQDSYCKRGCHDKGGCANGCVVPHNYDRLATYEDSGLSPSDVADIKALAEKMNICDLVWENLKRSNEIRHLEADNELLRVELSDLAKAKEEGKLVELPCKIGDTVWASDTTRIGEITDIDVYINDMLDDLRFSFKTLDKNNGQHLVLKHFSNEIGKIVFLTKEEAEEALKKIEKAGDSNAV